MSETTQEAPVADTTSSVEAPWASAQGMWNLGEGDAATPWYSTIPEEAVRKHVEAKGYVNPAELAMANWSLTKMQRGDSTVIGLPGNDATPEQMNEFYSKLGRPDAPEQYEFKFGEDVKVDDGMVQFARSAFHEAGLTPAQAQLVADKWNQFSAQQGQDFQAQLTEQNEKELQDLAAEWGDDLEKNKAAGRRAVKALGLDEDTINRIEDNIGGAPVVKLLALIGRKSDEGGFAAGSQAADPNNPATMTKEQAAQRIQQLQGDAQFQAKYTDKNHPEHKGAVEEMLQLFTRA